MLEQQDIPQQIVTENTITMKRRITMKTIDSEVLAGYNSGREKGRLHRGLGLIEFERTKEILLEELPSPPAVIYDIGGGYGEYGRQWENPLEVNKSTLFYSDYIKGIEGEIACQCILDDWLSISLGTCMVVGNGNISVDYQVGVGLNLNFDNF